MTSDRDIALSFMQALWAADFNATDALLSEDATWVFQLGMPQSQLRESRVWPARDAMRRIVADLFGKFSPDGFAVTVSHIIADSGNVAIEYEANGRTVSGRAYQNYYVTLLRVRDGQISDVRPYNDTLHIAQSLVDG